MFVGRINITNVTHIFKLRKEQADLMNNVVYNLGHGGRVAHIFSILFL